MSDSQLSKVAWRIAWKDIIKMSKQDIAVALLAILGHAQPEASDEGVCLCTYTTDLPVSDLVRSRGSDAGHIC